MKIICFNGSPKGKRSNSQRLAAEFLQGAQDAGAEVENVFLAGRSIGFCRACLSCWLKTPGVCIQKDDMADLLPGFVAADVVIFATPLYADHVTGIMKTFIDRLIPTLDPHVMRVRGETLHLKRYGTYPKIVVISNNGLPEPTHFQTLKLYFRRLARNMHSEVVGEIYRSGGEILRSRNPSLQPRIKSYKKMLRQAGEELVRKGRLSRKTERRLARPLVAHDRYVRNMNRYFDRRLSRLAAKE